jgi:hypothetical protein
MQCMHIVHDDIHCLITYIHAIYMRIVYTISKKGYVCNLNEHDTFFIVCEKNAEFHF